jgi:hypothetical protein
LGTASGNPGEDYLVLQPTVTADAFTVRLVAGTYTVEWFNIQDRQMTPREPSIAPRASA